MKEWWIFLMVILPGWLSGQGYYCSSQEQIVHEMSEEHITITPRMKVYLNVVIHVIHRTELDSIDDSQIHSQLEVLNEDFGQTNANFAETPEIFKQVAADTEVRFCLAYEDPNGLPTTGITRTKTNIENIGATDFYYQTNKGGKDAWDPTKYINIWVADNGSTQIIGKATFPGQANPPEQDGLLMNYRFFGRTGVAENFPPHDLGRGCVHEMGHYFGLPHIFGVIGGTCSEDDGFSDTPDQDEPTIDCPVFPKPDICTQGDGIMFMNFMDYTEDACMTMFTLQQKAKIWQVLNGERSGLLENTSDQCLVDVLDENPSISNWEFYPNPSSSMINILDSQWKKEEIIRIYSIDGRLIFWTKVLSPSTTIDVSFLNKGLYWISYKASTKKLVKN